MTTTISRRSFALTGACAVLTSRSASAQTTTELKVSHFLPPNHTFQKAMVLWSDDLEKQSGGRLKLRIYPAGQLGGGPNRQFDAARNGVVDIAISLHGATPGRYAMTELASLPFASPSAGNTSMVASRRLSELAPDLAKEHEGLRIMWMAVTPPLMFHSKAPIRTIADFKGKRIRYAGVQFKNIIDSLGAVPLLVPPQETQDGLAKGIIDAATFPYEGAASFDIATVAKYTLEPGVSSATFAVVMNPGKYASLPDDLRAMIDKTTGPEAAAKFGAMWDEAERDGKTAMLAKGTQVSTLAKDQLDEMKSTFKPQIEAAIVEVEGQGKPGRKFFEAYLK